MANVGPEGISRTIGATASVKPFSPTELKLASNWSYVPIIQDNGRTDAGQ